MVHEHIKNQTMVTLMGQMKERVNGKKKLWKISISSWLAWLGLALHETGLKNGSESFFLKTIYSFSALFQAKPS